MLLRPVFRWMLSLLLASVMAGCASQGGKTKGQGPDMVRAVNAEEVRGQTVVVEVPKLVPLPGQLMPEEKQAEASAKDSTQKAAPGAGAVIAATRQGTKLPALEGYFNAMMVFDYTRGALYKIYTAPQRITDVAFEPGETVGEVAAGDTLRWQVITAASGSEEDQQAHLLIKPMEPGLTNSFVITTDRRTYHLLVVSLHTSYMASVSWTYPRQAFKFNKVQDKPQPENRDKPPAAAKGAIRLDPHKLYFDYEIKLVKGEQPPWMPQTVFDNGQKVYIRLAPDYRQREAPVLYLGAGKTSRVVNYRVQEDYYIVDRLFDVAELRSGSGEKSIARITRRQEDENH